MSAPIKFSEGNAPGDPFWASRSVTAFKMKSGAGAPSNRYEAAIPSPSRPYLPALVQDARFDANAFTRWELARKVRYYARNTWLLPRLAEEDVKYTVGPHGLTVIPASSDPEWNKIMADEYAAFCEAPFRDSSLPMGQGMRLMWRETHFDGEVFANLTRLKWKGEKSRPAIELIESHRCSSPGYEFDMPKVGEKIVDGVKLGVDESGQSIGRPSSFMIRDGFEGDTWKELPAYNHERPIGGGVIHIYDPERIGMLRAVTAYAPILNQTADLETLAALEMSRAHANAEDAKIFETWNGELPESMRASAPSADFLTGQGRPPIPGTAVDMEVEKRVNQMRRILGSRMVAIRNGEKLSFPENPSPSAAEQWLWMLTISQICVARNIPMLLVLPESIQGTVGRGVLDDAHLSFLAKFAIMKRAAISFYHFFADWARYNNPRLADAPADFRKCHVAPPRACNVDKQRTALANIASIEAGTSNYDTVAAEDGTTAHANFLRKANNIADAKQIAAEVSKLKGYPVLPEEIIGNLSGVALKLAQAQAAIEGAEGDDPQKGKEKPEPKPARTKKEPEPEDA